MYSPRVKLLVPILYLLLALTSCQGPAASASGASGSQETVLPGVGTDTSPEPPQSPSDLAAEPPLDGVAMAAAVPDFLSPEQQDLYRRAYSFYGHLAGFDIEYAETLGLEMFPPKDYETVTIGGYPYLVSQGRYSNWADFEAAGRSLFTEDCWSDLKGGDAMPLFAEDNGRLCYIDISVASRYDRCNDIPDEFRLVETAEDEIGFMLIGHYQDFDETTDEAVIQSGYSYTQEFPIKMVLTGDGWRFDEFHSTSRDES